MVEVRDSPARDIFSLHVVLQGSHQMGRVLGTPPPPPSSPSPGSSGRHSGWGTIFGVCPYGIGLRWDISGHPYRVFAQNFDTFHMGRVVWPGEPFLKNHKKTRKFTFWENGHVQKIQKCHFSEKKPPEAQCRKRSRKLLRILEYIYIYIYLQKSNIWLPMKSLFFTEISKSDFFSKSQILIEKNKSKSKKWWNRKWSVWSIGTFCTAWIWRFVEKTVSWGGKVKSDIFENWGWGRWKWRFGGQNWVFQGRSKDENTLKYILDSSATIPAQFSYIK